MFDHISPAGGATKEACQRSTTAAMETATAMAIQQMKMKIVKSYLLLVENVHLCRRLRDQTAGWGVRQDRRCQMAGRRHLRRAAREPCRDDGSDGGS